MNRARLCILSFLLLAAACDRAPDYPNIAAARTGDRVLIIAPHIDDEAIGAAAYAMHSVRAGARVDVLYLTAGDDNFLSAAIEDRTLWPRARDYLREGAERIAEGRNAMQRLGISTFVFLGYPDRGLEEMLHHPGRTVASRGTGLRSVPYPQALSPGAEYTRANLLRDVRHVAAQTRPTVIITCVEFDAHPDHRAAATIGRMLADELRPEPMLLSYLVHAHEFPAPHRLARSHTLEPPERYRHYNWVVHPMSASEEQTKQRVLMGYTSQWNDPDLRLLMEAFIRRNELFIQTSGGTRAIDPARRRAVPGETYLVYAERLQHPILSKIAGTSPTLTTSHCTYTSLASDAQETVAKIRKKYPSTYPAVIR